MATSPESASSFRFASFRLDPVASELFRRGKKVRLQPQVLRVLILLLERAGEVVTREELQRAIWPADTFVDFEVGLSAAVYKLRQTLGDSAEAPRFIETIPRRGFRFIAPVYRDARESAKLEQPPVQVADLGAKGVRPSRLWRLSLLTILVAAVAGGWLSFGTKPAATATVRRNAPPPEAVKVYELGRYELGRWTEDDLKRSSAYFEQAVQADPSYAAAWAGLARSKALPVKFGFVPADRAISEAKEAALKALAADPSLGESHNAMAEVLMSEWSWIAAEAELRRALELDPTNADAHQNYGYLLLTQRRASEAIDEMRRAQTLDPSSPNKRNSLAVAYFLARKYDDALAIWRNNIAVEVNSGRRHLRLAFIYELKKMPADSFAEITAFLRNSGRSSEAADFGRIFQAHGYEAAHRWFLQREIEALRKNSRGDFEASTDYVALGDFDRALTALNAAVEKKETGVIYLGMDPRFDALRPDARFEAVLRSVGLPTGP